MPVRIPWDRYEVALLFSIYERIVNGSDISSEAAKLSADLRALAIKRGVTIDETYRNVNGMKMQIANVQYLFTNGKKGLAGASAMIRQMYELYHTNQSEYQTILKEAIQLMGASTSVEKAFLANTREKENVAINLRDRVLFIAAETFPNGIRPASIIDLNKLKRRYAGSFGEDIPESADIKAILQKSGVQNGDKVYVLADEQKQSLKNLIRGIYAEGHRVVYYSELQRLHGDLLESCHLFSAPLMKAVFCDLFPESICKAEWILADGEANDMEEVTRAFGEELVLDYQQIKARCPYLTLSAIKGVLSRSSRFVWSSAETFAQTDLIQLDPEEITKVQKDVIDQIQADGFYSLARLPLEESCTLNSRISASAVRDAMFLRYMAAQCSRNGLIATPKGVRATSSQLLEGWCKSQEQFTLAELEEYERELTGHHAVLGISAACRCMVRVDHDNFVSDALIDFDVEAADRAIALFAENRIIPITAITSFTSFPDVPGYTWNLYLVESYLRRFSKRFTIDGGPAQMSFVGGICPASMEFESYEDRLAYAVIQDRVSLNEYSIGRYLTEQKYILRRSGTVRKVLSKALNLKDCGGDSGVRL